MNVRVRLAPSPTGDVHIGNIRAGIYNFLFAKAMNGKFFLRIEDTDVARSKKEHVTNLLNVLSWLGLDHDTSEPMIFQSEHIQEYQAIAKKLYQEGYAYYCDCPVGGNVREWNSRDKNLRSGVLRFKVPRDQVIEFNDIVYKKLSINTNNLEDFALLRSDGMPTYMLCVVVDDMKMRISHVIRGEDHRTNTFKQILIYKALRAKQIPQFCHLPIMLGQDGKKLSKRNGNSSVKHYRKLGITRMGLINALARVGWGLPKSNQEIFTLNELIKVFKLEDIKKSAGKFNEHKIKYFAKWHLRNNNTKQEFYEYMNQYNLQPIEISDDFYNYMVNKTWNFSELYEMLKPLIEGDICNKNNVTPQELQQLRDLWKNDNILLNLKQSQQSNIMRKFILGQSHGPHIKYLLEYFSYDHIEKKLFS